MTTIPKATVRLAYHGELVLLESTLKEMSAVIRNNMRKQLGGIECKWDVAIKVRAESGERIFAKDVETDGGTKQVYRSVGYVPLMELAVMVNVDERDEVGQCHVKELELRRSKEMYFRSFVTLAFGDYRVIERLPGAPRGTEGYRNLSEDSDRLYEYLYRGRI